MFPIDTSFLFKKNHRKIFQVCKKKGYNSLCYDMSIAFLILTLKFCFSRYYFAVLEGERGRLKYGFGCSGAPNWNILTNPMLLLKKLTNLLDNTYTYILGFKVRNMKLDLKIYDFFYLAESFSLRRFFIY